MSYMFIDSNLPKPLTKVQIYDLFKKYHFGDISAKDEIIKHNIRLVINHVKKKFSNVQCDKNELVAIGLIGLFKSVDKFDISRDFEFVTYAARCIDNEILTFIKKENKYINNDSINESIKRNIDGEELTLSDTLVDDSLDFVTMYENSEIFKVVDQVVAQLPNREREIILLLFGFIDDKVYTQQEVAEKFHISQSHISRLKRRILEKLKNQLEENGVIDNNNLRESKKPLSKSLFQ